ncbi:hypothetical protein ACWC0C_39245 [Streptomyces sp. NPDC001709]
METEAARTRPARGSIPEETVIPAIRKTLTATALIGAVLTGVAACGTAEKLSAAQKIDRAVAKLGEQRSLSMELDLDTDTATLEALDTKADPGNPMPTEATQLLADARVSLSVQSKKPLKDSAEKDLTGMAVKFSSADTDLIEYRIAGDYAYLRADAKAIAAKTGSPLPAAEDLPETATALKALLNGQWIKISTADLKDGTGTGASAAPSPDASTQRKLTEALRTVLTREVALKDTGERGGTDHITATAALKTLLTELVDKVRPFAKDLPPGAALPSAKDLKDVPDEKATADFALKNGQLTKVTVNLAKLAENAKVKKFDLVVRLGTGETATAPSQATKVTMEELRQQFLGAPATGSLEQTPTA